MPVSNGRFSKPIRLKEDLANFFGLSANLGYIIKNANINMWSQFKPVPLRSPYHANSLWYSGDNGQCGYNIFNSTILKDVTDFIVAESAKNNYIWSYDKPLGGEEFFRMLDFEGYNHYSEPICVTAGATHEAYINQQEPVYIYYAKNRNIDNIEGNIDVSHIMCNGIRLTDMYLCAVVLDENNTPIIGNANQNPFDGENQYVNLFIDNNYQAKTYKVAMMLSSEYRELAYFKNGYSWEGGFYVCLPTRYRTLVVSNPADVQFYIDTYWEYSSGNRVAIQCDYYAINKSSAIFEIEDPTIKIGYFDTRSGFDEKVYLYTTSVNRGYNIKIDPNPNPVKYFQESYSSSEIGTITLDRYFVEIIFPDNKLKNETYIVRG